MWTEDRERKWEVDDVIVPIQRESVQEGCFGGIRWMVFYGVHDVRWVRGGFREQRRRSGFIGVGFSGLILCCFYSKQRDQNREVGMHSGWWVCIGSRDSVQLQLLRVQNNI